MTHDTLMALAQKMAVACVGRPDAVELIEARAALSTALSELAAERDEHKENAMRNARSALTFKAERDALQSERDMWEATAEATVDFDALRYRWLTRSGFKHAEIELSERGEERIPCVDYKITFSIPEPVGTEFDEQEDGWTLTDIDAAIDSAMKGTPT